MSGIFLAVDRCHMRRISVKIRSPDTKLLAVDIDPFPETFARGPSLIACPAVDADNVGGKAMTVAAAETPAVIRPVTGGLEAACDRLTVVIANALVMPGDNPASSAA